MDNIGRKIQDFYCNGYFGRRYDLAGSEIVGEGDEWIVIRIPNGEFGLADFYSGSLDKEEALKDWCDLEFYNSNSLL